MVADMDLQVWLETVANTRPSVVIPYVRSAEGGDLRYRLTAVRQGRDGSSLISQSGGVRLQAGAPTALTRFSLSIGNDDDCHIELLLIANGVASGTYRFDCPRGP